jgi:hypothetical protein
MSIISPSTNRRQKIRPWTPKFLLREDTDETYQRDVVDDCDTEDFR